MKTIEDRYKEYIDSIFTVTCLEQEIMIKRIFYSGAFAMMLCCAESEENAIESAKRVREYIDNFFDLENTKI